MLTRRLRQFAAYLSSFLLFWICLSPIFIYTTVDPRTESSYSSFPSAGIAADWVRRKSRLSYHDILDPFCAKFTRKATSEFYLNYTANHLYFPVHFFGKSTPNPAAKIHFAVNSAPKNFAARRTIRDTWKQLITSKNSECLGSLKFYVGKTKAEEPAQWLEREFRENPDDMVFIDFCDAYENLPMKTANIMKYVAKNHKEAEWVIKIDDDMMPNIPAFYQCFPKVTENRVDLYGWVSIDQIPERGDKYEIPKSRYAEEYFPPFTHGPAYAVRMSKVKDLVKKAETTPILNLEDVWFTGILAKELGVKRKNVTNFLAMKRKAREFDKNFQEVFDTAFFFHNIPMRIIRKAWWVLPNSCANAKRYNCSNYLTGSPGNEIL